MNIVLGTTEEGENLKAEVVILVDLASEPIATT